MFIVYASCTLFIAWFIWTMYWILKILNSQPFLGHDPEFGPDQV